MCFFKSLYNRILTWCAEFKNMMHVGAVWKCWIFVQKLSKCLHSFLELIYFPETFSISYFAKMLCSNSGLMNSLDHNIMAPQNFDSKFHIQKRMLKIWQYFFLGGLIPETDRHSGFGDLLRSKMCFWSLIMISRVNWDTFETFSILLRQENRYTMAYFSTEIDVFDGFKTCISVFLPMSKGKRL